MIQSIGPLYYREFLAKYAKFRQQIWAVRQGINPRDKNQKQANFCSQVVGQLRTPYSIKALWVRAKIKSNISSLLVSLSAKTSILRQNVMINPISSLGQGTNNNLVQCLGGRLAFQELYMHVLYNLGITNTLLSESTNASFSLCHDSRRFPLLALWK